MLHTAVSLQQDRSSLSFLGYKIHLHQLENEGMANVREGKEKGTGKGQGKEVDDTNELLLSAVRAALRLLPSADG